jgi:ribonuclease D
VSEPPRLVRPYTWIDTPEGLAAFVEQVSAEPAYALDTEFHRERTYWPELALVQLAGREGPVAVIDPKAVDLAPLAALLEGPGVAVVHAGDQDLEVLLRACGTVPARIFDTQVAAGFAGFVSASLSLLAARLIDVDLPKGDRMTDWTARPLGPDQLTYAAADVAHLIELRDVLTDRLDATGRLAWVEEECELQRARARGGQDPDTAWWRLKGARALRGRSKAVARSVAAWRERRAATVDRPVRHVLSDMAVLGIATRPPADDAALRRVRGLDDRAVRGAVGQELLAAVAEGLAADPRSVPEPPGEDVDRDARPAVTLAAAWTAQLAGELGIDPAQLATRADLAGFVRGDPASRVAHGWRAELVGARLRRLVDGEVALAFDGRGGLRLVELPPDAPRS